MNGDLTPRTLIIALDALAELGKTDELHKLYEQAGKSRKAFQNLKPKTKQLLQKNDDKSTAS